MRLSHRWLAGLAGAAVAGSVATYVVGSGSGFRSAALVPGSAAVGDLAVPLPTTTASLTPPANGAGWTNAAAVSVTLSASEPGPVAIASITYSGAGAQTIGSTTVAGSTTTFSIQNIGVTTLTYAAQDAHGHTETAKTTTVRLDPTGPAVAMVNPGPGLVDASVVLSATASDAGSGIATVQLLAEPPGASAFAPIGSPATSGPYQATWDTTSVPNGTASVEAEATDVAGNSTTSAPATITIDHGGDPVTTATLNPPPNPAGWTNAASVEVDLTATDANGPGVGSITYTMSGAQPVASTVVNAAVATPSVSTEGITHVDYFATDAEGKAAAPGTVAVSIDRTAPTGSITAPAAGPVTGTVMVRAGATDAGSGVASVQLQVEPAGTSSFVNLGTVLKAAPYQASWDTATGAFPDGDTALRAVITDVAGNVTTTPGVTVTLSNGAAPAPAPPPADAPAGSYVTPLATTNVTGTAPQTMTVPVVNADGTATSVIVTIPAGALPAGTTITVYSTDFAALGSALPPDGTAIASFAIAWKSTDPSHPTPVAGVPITITYDDPSIVAGSTVQELTSTGLLVWYPADVTTGQVTLTLTFDPAFVIAAPKPADGYWLAASDGGVFSFGGAGYFGGLGGAPINRPVVALAPAADRKGYWLAAADGGVFAFGDARFHGSTGSIRLNRPIVGMQPTPTGAGYWLVASDGGVFAFGDAAFYGSTGGLHLNQPIVGMAVTSTARGYWLVAADGGVFAFGDARFFGSTGALRLNRPIVGIARTATGRGYWLVGSDGGVFAFGDATFFGSAGGQHLAGPVAAITSTPTGLGYWLTGSDGGVFAFGDASYLGGTGGRQLTAPVIGLAPR